MHRPPRIGGRPALPWSRLLLALRKVPARRLRPAGRLTCRVHGQNRRRRERRRGFGFFPGKFAIQSNSPSKSSTRRVEVGAPSLCVHRASSLDPMHSTLRRTYLSTFTRHHECTPAGPRASPTPTMHQMPPLPLPLRSVASVATLCFPSHASTARASTAHEQKSK